MSDSIHVLLASSGLVVLDSLEDYCGVLLSSSQWLPRPGSPGSPTRAGDGLDAATLEQHQVGGAVAAGNAGLVTRANVVPVVAGLGAARSARVVHGAMFTLGSY